MIGEREARLERLQASYKMLGEIASSEELPSKLVESARAFVPRGRCALIEKHAVAAAVDEHGTCELFLADHWTPAKYSSGDTRDLDAPIYCGVGHYAAGVLGRTRLALYIDGIWEIDEAFASDFQAFTAFASVVVGALRAAEADRKAATTDALTGLWNRRALEYHLRIAIEERVPFAYAMIDLDKFKQINDTLGHQAGDAVLKKVGDTLRRNLRSCDFPARLAGDEFVVLVHDSNGTPAVERIRGWLAAAGIAASVGVAHFPDDGGDAQSLYAAADRSLYEAKKARR